MSKKNKILASTDSIVSVLGDDDKSEIKMKLSDRQKEVIVLMRNGGILFIPHSYFLSPINKVIIRNGCDYSYLNKKIFISLKSRGLIYQYKYIGSDQSIYKLTQLGKTIEL